MVRKDRQGMNRVRTLFIALADLDHLIDMVLFECSGNNDEVVLI
jgi:hypothetical protein